MVSDLHKCTANTCDLLDNDKKAKCQVCGKVFDRPSIIDFLKFLRDKPKNVKSVTIGIKMKNDEKEVEMVTDKEIWKFLEDTSDIKKPNPVLVDFEQIRKLFTIAKKAKEEVWNKIFEAIENGAISVDVKIEPNPIDIMESWESKKKKFIEIVEDGKTGQQKLKSGERGRSHATRDKTENMSNDSAPAPAKRQRMVSENET